MSERAYVSKSSDSVRMFESDAMEFLSRVHPATPLLLYLPLIIASLYFAFSYERLSILSVVGFFGFGLMIWTLLEYIIHRYAFHYEPKSRIGNQFHFIVHGVQLDYPVLRLVRLSFPVRFACNLGRLRGRLRWLRFNSLRDPSFPDEKRHFESVEAAPSPSPLPR
jgi:hypothetical protein